MKKIYGLIGYPVKHSLSKIMQEAAFKACNINAEYRLIPVKPEELEDFLLNDKKVSDISGNPISIQDLSGFNITVPHKVQAIKKNPIIRIVDTNVILVGAVNTVKINKDDEKLDYYNTDVKGFIDSLREDLKFNPDGKHVFIFGCGGASRAVIAGLLPKEGFRVKKIFLYDIHREAIASIKEHFKSFDWIAERLEPVNEDAISDKIKDCDLLVNASPVGMEEGDSSPVDRKLLHKDLYVYDVVYNRKTQLIKDAESAGLNARGGLGMLLYQGALGFEIWTGQKAPVEVMRKALEEAMTK